MISTARKAQACRSARDGWRNCIAIQPLCVMSDGAAGPTAAPRVGVPAADERARCTAAAAHLLSI